LTLIRFHKTTRYGSEDELLSDINFKLLRAVGKLDPAKGSAFTFLSSLIQNTLHATVSRARVVARRHVEFDETAANNLSTNGKNRSRDPVDDLAHRIRSGVKTTHKRIDIPSLHVLFYGIAHSVSCLGIAT
jgi:hypothetical protein